MNSDQLKSVIAILSLTLLFTFACMYAKPYHSNSGSMKILRTYGEVIKTNDTLNYYSNDFENLNELEIRAILKLKSVTNIKILK